MAATFWAFVPAILAIVLALITKQVYISLFAGIFLGGMFLAAGNPLLAFGQIFEQMGSAVGGNLGILVFLVMLGIMVVLMSKAGGTRAYGDWASSKIKTRTGALGATAALGCVIFVDDYFNCLTVGNVMRPVTDKFNVSRAKLAYLIDSTAAPICIIAPISSWAAAVSSNFDEGEGLMMFIKTIPFNLYALLTIAMVIFMIAKKFDFGKMRKNEANAIEKGDLLSGETDLPSDNLPEAEIGKKGKVRYLVIPIIALIISCIGSMIYTGYFYDYDAGTISNTVQISSFLDAFASCNASLSLAIGSTIAVIFTCVYYLCAKVLTFKNSMSSIAEGFKSMVPAILILILAWTISGIMGAKGGGLDAQGFVEANITADNLAMGVVPAVFFLLAVCISFATGTSWGTFGILLAITVPVTAQASETLMILTMAAVLAGAVYGDHVSPISDTTILSSSGAQCNHIDHVKTQMPYATLVASVCFIGFLCGGFIAQSGIGYGLSVLCTLLIGAALLACALCSVYFMDKKGALEKMSLAYAAGKTKLKSNFVKAEPQSERLEEPANEIAADDASDSEAE